MSVQVTNNLGRFKAQTLGNVQVALRLMLEDIHRESNPITPYKEGALRTMVLKRMDGPYSGVITWQAPYAEYQERGYTNGPVTHYTTPGTQAHFAQESVEKVVNNSERYFRQAGVIR